MKKFNLNYLKDTIVIVPRQDFEDLEEIMVELGDFNIVSCNEINMGGDHWVLSGDDFNIYTLSPQNQTDLFNGEKTTLNKVGSFADEVETDKQDHLDFVKWFLSTKDEQAAVQDMYDKSGWVVTDIDSYQAYKEVEKDELYIFRENRGDEELGFDMTEAEIRYSEIAEDELIEACKDFGYEDEEIQGWMSEGEDRDIPLVVECYFEMKI